MEKVLKRKRLHHLSVVENVNVGTVNEKTKESNSEEEEIGIHKCRRKGRIDKINEEVKCGFQVEYVPRGPDCFMPRNNLACTGYECLNP